MYDETPASFRERMDECQDRAAWERHDDDGRIKAKVTWRMPAKRIETTADGLAALLGCSGARVRLLLASGRVQGAFRARKGKNRPWIVPLYFDGSRHRPRLSQGQRGPSLPALAEGHATQTLSKTSQTGDLPF